MDPHLGGSNSKGRGSAPEDSAAELQEERPACATRTNPLVHVHDLGHLQGGDPVVGDRRAGLRDDLNAERLVGDKRVGQVLYVDGELYYRVTPWKSNGDGPVGYCPSAPGARKAGFIVGGVGGV